MVSLGNVSHHFSTSYRNDSRHHFLRLCLRLPAYYKSVQSLVKFYLCLNIQHSFLGLLHDILTRDLRIIVHAHPEHSRFRLLEEEHSEFGYILPFPWNLFVAHGFVKHYLRLTALAFLRFRSLTWKYFKYFCQSFVWPLILTSSSLELFPTLNWSPPFCENYGYCYSTVKIFLYLTYVCS